MTDGKKTVGVFVTNNTIDWDAIALQPHRQFIYARADDVVVLRITGTGVGKQAGEIAYDDIDAGQGRACGSESIGPDTHAGVQPGGDRTPAECRTPATRQSTPESTPATNASDAGPRT